MYLATAEHHINAYLMLPGFLDARYLEQMQKKQVNCKAWLKLKEDIKK